MGLALIEAKGKGIKVQEVGEVPKGLPYAELPLVQGIFEAHRQGDGTAEDAGLAALPTIFYQLGLRL